MIIAIDGPAASGKSTTAKKIADELCINYIDTGAMYRACALKLIKLGIEMEDTPELRAIIDSVKIDFDNNGRKIILDGFDVSEEIRTDAVSSGASQVATIGFVREKMTELQRKIGLSKSVVMDGRDIGSAVFPNADFKFYLDASVEARAKRRYLEAVEKKENLSLEEIKSSIISRDKADMNREISPLVKAEGAIEIDTSNLTIPQQVEKILEIVGR